MKQIKIFLIEHQSAFSKMLFAEISRHQDLVLVGRSATLYEAQTRIFRLKPDVVLLDLDLPHADVASFLEMLVRHSSVPVIVTGSRAPESRRKVLEALEGGAVEAVSKPLHSPEFGEEAPSLADKIRGAAGISSPSPPAGPKAIPPPRSPSLLPSMERGLHKLVALGASTGGTRALEWLLPRIPLPCPPVVLVQHMPAAFTADFARRLDSLGPLEVREARHGDAAAPGVVLVAPGNVHMKVRRPGLRYTVALEEGPPESGHRPSVDVLFRSVAACARGDAVGVLLTGMGRDGARGLLEIRRAGGKTLVQDEKTSVVFGMPGEALALGAAGQVAPLQSIPSAILRMVVDEL